MSVSVVIPTLNAENEIALLLNKLLEQTHPLQEIIVIDSSSDDRTRQIVSSYPSVVLATVKRSEFNHGLTRDQALKKCSGEIICFMTQDAVPATKNMIECLVDPIERNKKIAISSARQLPKENARRFEQLVRFYNYGSESYIRSYSDLSKVGIKTYCVSDVCAAYRRDAYIECGGFSKVETNEDMLMAAKAINLGWNIAYVAEAKVYHSHNLSLRQQFERNRAVGRFLHRHADELGNLSEYNEGINLVSFVIKTLIKEHAFRESMAFCADCGARLIGNRVGKRE